MTTKLKWRLSKLPTPSELQELLKAEIITQDEAREILFSEETEVKTEDLKSEIKFLREVVEDLSKSRSNKVTVIEKHIKSYPDWTWNQPYYNYCSTGGITDANTILQGDGTTVTSASSDLTNLKTF